MFDHALLVIMGTSVAKLGSPSETKATVVVGKNSVPVIETTKSLNITGPPVGGWIWIEVPSRTAFEGSMSATTLIPVPLRVVMLGIEVEVGFVKLEN